MKLSNLRNDLVRKFPAMPAALQRVLTAHTPLPAFVVAGATRSGSSTLHKLLGLHPDIEVSDRKELWFFNTDSRHDRGAGYYKSFFRAPRPGGLVGEATPFYLNTGTLFQTENRDTVYFSDTDTVAKRMAEMIPDTRIIISLRAPLTRIESIFSKNSRQDKIRHPDINQKLRDDLAGAGTPQYRNLVQTNQYKQGLEQFYAHFPAEQIKVLVFERWSQDAQGTCAELFDFLGVPPFADVALPENLNQRALYGAKPDQGVHNDRISPEVQDMVLAHLEPDIAYVEALVGHDLPEWRSRI